MSSNFPKDVDELLKEKKKMVKMSRSIQSNKYVDDEIASQPLSVYLNNDLTDVYPDYKKKKFAKILADYDLKLRAFHEEDNPELFEESVDIISKCIKNTESNLHHLIKLSGFSYNDLGYYIYSSLVKGKKTGQKIDEKELILNVERVTEVAVQKGIDRINKNRPFFFENLKDEITQVQPKREGREV